MNLKRLNYEINSIKDIYLSDEQIVDIAVNLLKRLWVKSEYHTAMASLTKCFDGMVTHSITDTSMDISYNSESRVGVSLIGGENIGVPSLPFEVDFKPDGAPSLFTVHSGSDASIIKTEGRGDGSVGLVNTSFSETAVFKLDLTSLPITGQLQSEIVYNSSGVDGVYQIGEMYDGKNMTLNTTLAGVVDVSTDIQVFSNQIENPVTLFIAVQPQSSFSIKSFLINYYNM